MRATVPTRSRDTAASELTTWCCSRNTRCQKSNPSIEMEIMPSTGLLTKIKPEIIAMIQRFDCAGDDLAAKSKELSLMLLTESEYPFSRRQFTPGHITCTAAVLDPRRKRVLLMFHHRLLRWLLPGGHCEGDDQSISGVAARE